MEKLLLKQSVGAIQPPHDGVCNMFSKHILTVHNTKKPNAQPSLIRRGGGILPDKLPGCEWHTDTIELGACLTG